MYILVYTMFLTAVTDALEKNSVKYALAGGLAVAFHGAVRGTVDVDLVITLAESSFLRAEAAMKSLGLEPRLPVSAKEVFRFREEYIKNRNLIAWSFHNLADASQQVDFIITEDLARATTKRIVVGRRTLFILSKQSLIEMKRRSGRPQDLEDIKALEALS